MNRLDKGKETLIKEGLANFVGKSIRLTGVNIGNLIISESKIKNSIKKNYSDDKKYLNVGGGNFLKENWRVLDFYSDSYDYHGTMIDYNVDLEMKTSWPIEEESYNLVYSSHTLEHLSSEAVAKTLEESYRILRPGSGIRLNIPDCSIAVKKYKEKDLDWFRNVWMGYVDDRNDCRHPDDNYEEEYWLEFYLISFFASYLVRSDSYQIDLKKVREKFNKMNQTEFLNHYSQKVTDEMQSERPEWHRNWFTHDKIKRKLKSVGFSKIEKTECRKSRFNEMNKDGFDKRPHMSLYIEGVK